MKEKNSQFTGSKEYLEKSFLEELSYKIWSTKGARFQADKRLKKKSKLSTISLAILSAYLIIASLISVYNINNGGNENLINYSITALSILLLVANMFENNQDYKLRANTFHNCGLELGILYSKLRTFKTLKENSTNYEIYRFCQELTENYQNVLNKYENHDPIDYDKFKTLNTDHFKELSESEIKQIKKRYNWEIYGWYTIMICLPPILIITLILFSK